MTAVDRPSCISFQTARLARGRHSSPEEGVSVIELASLIAGERFGDHPRAVCPVIAGFLRAVDDHLPVEDLPELYPLAAAIVGTRRPRKERRVRARECARWAADLGVDRRPFAIWLGRRWGLVGSLVGELCGRAAMGRGGHDLALALLEALLPTRAIATAPSPALPAGDGG